MIKSELNKDNVDLRMSRLAAIPLALEVHACLMESTHFLITRAACSAPSTLGGMTTAFPKLSSASFQNLRNFFLRLLESDD